MDSVDNRCWVDKHRPQSIDDLTFHPDLTDKLKCLAAFKDFPHLLFQGPQGAGKMTRVHCLLRCIFGECATKVSTSVASVQISSSVTEEVEALHSKCHVELNLQDYGDLRDAAICRTYLKEYAGTPPPNGVAFKVVVLKGADAMSHGAQAALRRLMEVYVANCRFFLVCETASHLIGPLQSRCLCFRVASPTVADITTILSKVLERENVTNPPSVEVLSKIAEDSRRDLRKALIKLERVVLLGNTESLLMPWETKIADIVKDIVDKSKHNPRGVLALRNILFELQQGSVQPDVILECITRGVARQCPAVASEVYFMAATYEPMMRNCQKKLFALDAFVNRTMVTVGPKL